MWVTLSWVDSRSRVYSKRARKNANSLSWAFRAGICQRPLDSTLRLWLEWVWLDYHVYFCVILNIRFHLKNCVIPLCVYTLVPYVCTCEWVSRACQRCLIYGDTESHDNGHTSSIMSRGICYIGNYHFEVNPINSSWLGCTVITVFHN